ncbi:MAG: serine/threonine-protein kinase [Casimicrobiaceae bacterium]
MIAQLGKYEIRRELARGAMGVVYEDWDLLIKRRVALKTIRPDQFEGEQTADMIARFRREPQAAGRLIHPNIVPIYDFDEDEGTWFIAMEFVDGRELSECFAADPEQIMGLPVDGRSDHFAAGVILYQFATGERPFAGSSTTTMQKVLKEEPLPPSTLNVQLPPAIDAVVRKALAKRAHDRFQSAQAFSLALRAAMRAGAPPGAVSMAAKDPDATMPNLAAIGTDTTARASSQGRRTGPEIVQPVPADATRNRTTAVAIVAAIAVIGIAALAATWWLFPRQSASPVVQAKAPAAEPAAAVVAQAPVAHASPARRRPKLSRHDPERWSYPRWGSPIRAVRATPTIRRCCNRMCTPIRKASSSKRL